MAESMPARFWEPDQVRIRKSNGEHWVVLEFTPENGVALAEMLGLEYIPQHNALYLPGHAHPLVGYGYYVGKPLYDDTGDSAMRIPTHVLDLEFDRVVEHPFVPSEIGYSQADSDHSSCMICGEGRYDVSYHRDWIDGELVKLANGTSITLNVKVRNTDAV